jgi:hypothetical protein
LEQVMNIPAVSTRPFRGPARAIASENHDILLDATEEFQHNQLIFIIFRRINHVHIRVASARASPFQRL